QLTSQGFTRIADFSRNGGDKYFMEDTIHLGWNGWLAFDKEVVPFLEDQTPPSEYQLDPYFLSKDWADRTAGF
ncbi:D-alanyl-lipoteichoic acid biosynthesis protein DltD, partial [Streptococcus equi]